MGQGHEPLPPGQPRTTIRSAAPCGLPEPAGRPISLTAMSSSSASISPDAGIFRQCPDHAAGIAFVFVPRLGNLPDTDGIPHIDQNLPDGADRRFDVNLAEVPLHGAIVPALRPHRKMSNEKAPPPSGERALISCRKAEAPCPHAASARTPSMAAVT